MKSLKYALLVLWSTTNAISIFDNLNHCSTIENVHKIDCHPEPNSTEDRCLSRGCCWNPQQKEAVGLPQCFYPTNYVGYNVSTIEVGDDSLGLLLKRNKPSGLPKDIQEIKVQLDLLSDTMVRIRITDATSQRYEPPLPKLNLPKKAKQASLYRVSVSPTGELQVTRISNGKTIFKTDLRYLIFSNQFHQLTTTLPNDHFIGLGERRDVFMKNATWKKYTLYNNDHGVDEHINLYGSHPFHFSVEDSDGHASGTFLLNSNAMDILTNPQPSITYRPIGGILDFFVFVENSPEDLIKSYHGLIGLPQMPPLWSLGFHLCKYGYGSLNKTVEAWNRTRNAGIPFEAQWIDIDYMKDYNDFTYDNVTFAGLPEFVEKLHKLGMRFVVILDPGVDGGAAPGTYPPYDDGVKMNVFVKNASGQVLVSHTWNLSGKTVYPDFTHPNATAYWTKQVQEFHKQVEFDGLWIDMNEPGIIDGHGSWDGCPVSELETPIYRPGEVPLQTKSICMTAKMHLGNFYDLRNLYASFEAIATEKALKTTRPGKRPFVVSRASFPGLGHHAAHWSGDIYSDWSTMRWTIGSTMEWNIFGVPLVGSDICGFTDNTTVEMCARWSLLGAFYPFSRNHNTIGTMDQDPASLGEVVVKANQVAMDLRYRLLPYLYTLFYRAHIYAETVARPLFFVFPKDEKARHIDTQFMWGDGLLIAPVVEEGSNSVHAYIPAGRWYFLDTFDMILSNGQYFDFETPIDKINVLLRGGKVIAMADSKVMTTVELQGASFKIVAALDHNGTASGQLYWDDGESLDAIEEGNYNLVQFEVAEKQLKTMPSITGYHFQKKLSSVVVLGVSERPKLVKVNGEATDDFVHDSKQQSLQVSLMKSKYDIFESNLITWV